jgi:hypothetical protein
MKVMKKIYVKPEIQANEIKVATQICTLSKTNEYATKNGTVLGKERGTRTSDDDFDDLW